MIETLGPIRQSSPISTPAVWEVMTQPLAISTWLPMTSGPSVALILVKEPTTDSCRSQVRRDLDLGAGAHLAAEFSQAWRVTTKPGTRKRRRSGADAHQAGAAPRPGGGWSRTLHLPHLLHGELDAESLLQGGDHPQMVQRVPGGRVVAAESFGDRSGVDLQDLGHDFADAAFEVEERSSSWLAYRN